MKTMKIYFVADETSDRAFQQGADRTGGGGDWKRPTSNNHDENAGAFLVDEEIKALTDGGRIRHRLFDDARPEMVTAVTGGTQRLPDDHGQHHMAGDGQGQPAPFSSVQSIILCQPNAHSH